MEIHTPCWFFSKFQFRIFFRDHLTPFKCNKQYSSHIKSQKFLKNQRSGEYEEHEECEPC